MKISFGKGATAWGNYGVRTPIVEASAADIRRFGRVMRFVNKLEWVFAFVPIWLVLRLFCFSSSFAYGMVFPLTALFFGTGNQTPRVSSAIFARVFLDPKLRLFDYDSTMMLAQQPRMYALPQLSRVYATIIAGTPGVQYHFGRPVARVERPSAGGVLITDAHGVQERFDRIVFTCDAETALRVLAKPTRAERWALGSVQYYDDVTVTHVDERYMRSHYDVNEQRGDQYYVRSEGPVDATAPAGARIEMSFDLTHYQPQLRDPVHASHPHVYQTIFLDARFRGRWSMAAIDPSKVLLTKWWRQFSHSWRHYLRVVPLMRFAQGSAGGTTFYAGSWTLVNTHEIAIISGLAAAYRLGCPYPADFASDAEYGALAVDQFRTYLSIIHGVRFRAPKRPA